MQFGANDQKPAADETLLEYQTNLQNLALDVKKNGGTPVSWQPAAASSSSSRIR